MALETNLTAYYKLDETTGTTSADSVASYDGTIIGADYTASGKIGGAREFVSTNSDRIDLPVAVTSGKTIGSVAFWIKSNAAINYFLSQNDYDDAGDYIALYTNASSQFEFDLGTGGDWRGHSTSTTVGNGNWHHIVFTGNGTTNTLYIDGVADTIVMTDGNNDGTRWGSTGAGQDKLTLGALYRASALYANCTLDEVGFWDRVLTSDEAAALYNGGSGIQYPFTPASTDTGAFFNFF